MAAWSLVSSWTFSVNVPNVDFTGLGAYTDVKVFMRNVTLSASGLRVLRVSINNGSTFLSTAGDYIDVASSGAETVTATGMGLHVTSSNLARSGDMEISGFNLTTPKVAQRMNRVDARTYIIPTTSALNAVRVLVDGTINLTGGNIYCYAR